MNVNTTNSQATDIHTTLKRLADLDYEASQAELSAEIWADADNPVQAQCSRERAATLWTEYEQIARDAGLDLGETDDEERTKDGPLDSADEVDGYSIPVDPMELVQCDGCQ